MTTLQDDLNTRWRPSAEVEAKARQALATNKYAEIAIIALVQPGKDYGVWCSGQEVVTIDRVFLAVQRDGTPRIEQHGVSYYGIARNLALIAATEVLKNDYANDGTTAYALVYRDDEFMPVFED